MKKQDIKVGKVYHNGKSGRFYSEREVIGEGPEFLFYKGQEDTDCLKYRVKKGRNQGQEFNMTRTSFAAWAKDEVNP